MNMGYCRMENTYKALEDCADALQNKEFKEFSKSEQEYAKKLIELCQEIYEQNSDLLEISTETNDTDDD